MAVSGGMDSMAMAELFSLAGYEFSFVHCNFKLRGREADVDEAFIIEAAERYGVQCFHRSFETARIADETGNSIQMVARDLRYAYFEEIASEHGFDHIATAHHLDDQIETFFINLSRGCGIAGLHGIPIKNGKIIRPLMFSYRKDIEGFVIGNNVAFREDSSNKSLKYQRNKIRHELLPVFLEMNPSFREEMSANIQRLAATEEVYRQVVELARKEVVELHENEIRLDIAKLKMFSPVSQILYELIAAFGYKQDDIEKIMLALNGIPGKKFLTQSHQLVIDRKEILISSLNNTIDEEVEIFLDSKGIDSPLALSFVVHPAEDYSIPTDKMIASLDLDVLSFPLQLRKWRQGDSFIPLGMKNHKKLSDFFIDEKFSLPEKERTWILCSGDNIVWILGHRISDLFKITENTGTVYQIKIS